MDHTKNYHLPQWVKSDRIMMEDFNDAMASIDTGINGVRTEALASSTALTKKIEQVQSSAEEKIAQAKAAAEDTTALYNGLFRIAYNHYFQLAESGADPHQTGVFHQSFARDAGSAPTGFYQLEDRIWTAGSNNALTLSALKSTLLQTSVISSKSDTLVLTFTAPNAGRLTKIRLHGGYQNPSLNENDGTVTVRLRNQTAGKLEAEQRVHLSSFNYPSGAGTYQLTVDLLLHKGQSYRLEIKLNNMNIIPEYQLDLTEDNCLTLESFASGSSTSVSHTFQAGDTGSGGLFIVRHNSWGTGGSIVLDWCGKQYTAASTRTVTDKDGRSMQESEFRIVRSVPASSTATLRLTCNQNGELFLYQWGGVLIG